MVCKHWTYSGSLGLFFYFGEMSAGDLGWTENLCIFGVMKCSCSDDVCGEHDGQEINTEYLEKFTKMVRLWESKYTQFTGSKCVSIGKQVVIKRTSVSISDFISFNGKNQLCNT